VRDSWNDSGSMNCTDFLARFSDFLDGSLPAEEVTAMDEHAASCPSCGRYRVVVENGASILRSLPEPELREDFVPRLRHRIYSVDEERSAAEQSGTPALTVLGIAILLTALAWAPVLRGGGRDVLLEPIVIDRAPREVRLLAPVLLTPPGQYSTSSPGQLADGLWDGTSFYDYSALSRRYDQRGRVRRVADYDR